MHSIDKQTNNIKHVFFSYIDSLKLAATGYLDELDVGYYHNELLITDIYNYLINFYVTKKYMSHVLLYIFPSLTFLI